MTLACLMITTKNDSILVQLIGNRSKKIYNKI